jgi:hypothetical protein
MKPLYFFSRRRERKEKGGEKAHWNPTTFSLYTRMPPMKKGRQDASNTIL